MEETNIYPKVTKDFNLLLVIVLNLAIINSLIKIFQTVVSVIMNVHEWTDFEVLHALIAGLIHCVLLGYFLWKKDKIGYYIVMAYQIINGLILSFATGEFIINLSVSLFFIVLINLLLLLRKKASRDLRQFLKDNKL